MKHIYKDFQELYAVLRGKIVEVKPIERKKPKAETTVEEPKEEPKAEEPKPKKKTSRKKKEE